MGQELVVSVPLTRATSVARTGLDSGGIAMTLSCPLLMARSAACVGFLDGPFRRRARTYRAGVFMLRSRVVLHCEVQILVLGVRAPAEVRIRRRVRAAVLVNDHARRVELLGEFVHLDIE